MIPFSLEEVEGTVGARFERVAAFVKDGPALAEGGATWTYDQLLAATEAYRQGFAKLLPAMPVALVFSRESEAVIAMMGALRAGLPVLPISPTAPPEGVQASLANCQVVVTEPAHEAWCRENAGSVGVASRPADIAALVPKQVPPVAQEAIGMIYMTSGTTGQSKGLLRSDRCLNRHILHLAKQHRYGPGDRVAQMSSFAFAGAVPVVLGALLSGAALEVISVRTSDAGALAQTLVERKVTILQLTTSLMRELIDVLSIHPTAWQPRLIVLSGEPLRSGDLASLRAKLGWTCDVVNRLASSECGIVSEWIVDESRLGEDDVVPVGRAVDYREVTIVDENGDALPPGQIGEIIVSGDYLASGYWNQPQLTAERFTATPCADQPHRRRFASGDMGRLSSDGLLDHLGRKDSMVKVRGYRIEIGAVEAALRKLPGIADAAVIVGKTVSRDEYLLAYVQPSRGVQVQTHGLRQSLLARLPEFMVPSRIQTIAALPQTSGNKINRRALPPPDRSRPTGLPPYVAPVGDVELRLAKLWSNVLDCDEISREDDFFDLGGDSLLLLSLVTSLQANETDELDMSEAFVHTTLRTMAQALEAVLAKAQR